MWVSPFCQCHNLEPGLRKGGRTTHPGNQVKPQAFKHLPHELMLMLKSAKIYQHPGVETDLHGGTNQDPCKQMCMTDRQLLRMSRNQQTVKVQLHKLLLGLSDQ